MCMLHTVIMLGFLHQRRTKFREVTSKGPLDVLIKLYGDHHTEINIL
jgi:hypothetical protein